MTRLPVAGLFFALAAAMLVFSPGSEAAGQIKKRPKGRPAVPAKEPPATDPATMKIAKGFKVELLYSVPRSEQGSWVNMCVDPQGRLIVSDQYGSLYRVTPPAIGTDTAIAIEKIPARIGMAQGLLWAFDSLYVVVNGPKSGLYRVTSSQKNDTLDTVELLRSFDGGNGEHGPHAVIAHPDGKRITVVCGDQTKLVKYDTTRVPPYWGEDHLLPRLPDGNGFMAGVLGPGGAIYNVTPDGKQWELYSVGYRNQFDAAYHSNGDLFTYDADMEWDFNTPWYRPTRVCLATAGSDFGWRNGAGKYPVFYPDTLPAVLNIGPGSPTGVCFGYGAKFPAKYQNAFYICDWSYGKLYAVHLTPDKSAYKGEAEEFVTGTPLPLTDVVINPKDGAMYFTIGGRKTKSGLYRVTYIGSESTAPAIAAPIDFKSTPNHSKRFLKYVEHTQDALSHGFIEDMEKEIVPMWDFLGNRDRFVSYTARTALEMIPKKVWAEKALAESSPQRAILSLLALTRVSAPCPFHRKQADPPADPALRARILESLGRIDFAKLDDQLKLDLIRVYQVLFNRFGKPTDAETKAVIARFSPAFPDKNRFVNGMLCELLVYLEAPGTAAKASKLLAEAPTQEEQMEYARSLRMLKTGWTPELRTAYFQWFVKAGSYRGGASYAGFVRLIKADAVKSLSKEEAVALKPLIDARPGSVKLPESEPRPFVKAYKMDDLVPALEKGLKSGRDFDRGRKLFAAARCFGCHRFDNEGGAHGPDLTGIAGRFSPRDLLESVLEPSKEISDQYAAVEIRTLDDRIIVGRIVNLKDNNVMVNSNMLDPGSTTSINRNNIESMKPSKVSMMPSGLLDTFKEAEVLDLLAYMLSRGDRNHAMFAKN